MLKQHLRVATSAILKFRSKMVLETPSRLISTTNNALRIESLALQLLRAEVQSPSCHVCRGDAGEPIETPPLPAHCHGPSAGAQW